MMKYLEATVLGAAILVTLCDTFCFQDEPNKDNPPQGCFYNGELHALQSEWRTEDCFDCHCNLTGALYCCTAYGRPVGYDKKKCKFVFNKKICAFELLPNKNPNKKCETYSMVG